MRPARHAAPEPPAPTESDPPATGIIRRTPSGAIPVAHPDVTSDASSSASEAPATWGHLPPAGDIIRRTPTGAIPIPVAPTNGDATATSLIDTGADAATGLMLPGLTEPDTPATTHIAVPGRSKDAGPKQLPGPAAACATATASVLSGWATAVIATSLIAGWWRTDPLFCVAVGFLAAVAAAATIGGQIAVLLRRRTGRVLVVVGSVVALMIFASLFVAGAKLPPIVYGIPLLPIASIVLATLPVTGRWCTKT
ncbi:hypothetical protein [Mycobacterium sp. OTB74]|uniref:hypothetical protein n=1 Tax=Mycobacterium sp. OTB74 TaxID=1853452 RepID=UPI00247655F8|nr:hypothetical protein [Mycobacterium sp. OTB74]